MNQTSEPPRGRSGRLCVACAVPGCGPVQFTGTDGLYGRHLLFDNAIDPALGTRDGATIEMAEEAGEETFFLFGLTAQQVADKTGGTAALA